MKNIQELHNEAMELAENALFHKLKGDFEKAVTLLEQAFELEKEAALSIKENISDEPTRSILFRSAASLAQSCGKFRDAEIMVALGLSGNPPTEIADELRNLMEEVNFQRHLELKGISLDPNEIQISITGVGVGFGIVRSEEFLVRIDAFEKLAFRTAERKLGKKFRDKGTMQKDIKTTFESYISVPRAASFAVTLRLGNPTGQLSFPYVQKPAEVIDDMLQGVELINKSQEGKLKEKIKQESYLINFIALSRKLAPDGKKIKQVGFTVYRAGEEKKVSLTRKRNDILLMSVKKELSIEKAPRISVTGKLSYADAEKRKIKLTDKKGKKYQVIIPEGLMSDIVKPYWEDIVTVHGKLVNKIIHLENVEKIE